MNQLIRLIFSVTVYKRFNCFGIQGESYLLSHDMKSLVNLRYEILFATLLIDLNGSGEITDRAKWFAHVKIQS